MLVGPELIHALKSGLILLLKFPPFLKRDAFAILRKLLLISPFDRFGQHEATEHQVLGAQQLLQRFRCEQMLLNVKAKVATFRKRIKIVDMPGYVFQFVLISLKICLRKFRMPSAVL